MELHLSDNDVERIAARVAGLIRNDLRQPPAATPPTRYVRESELAKGLGLKVKTLALWRRKGHVKATTNVRPIVYSPEQVEAAEQFLLESGAARDVRQLAG